MGVNFYKTIDDKMYKIEDIQKGCWINIVGTNHAEINDLCNKLKIDSYPIKTALDNEELSRIEFEDDYKLILTDIPIDKSDDNKTNYETIPLGIVLLDDYIITVCSSENRVINDFVNGYVKNFQTDKKIKFLFQILQKSTTYYLFYLRKINYITNFIEGNIYKSMKNKELIQLLELEKSLVYFSTSLKANEMVIQKILRSSSIKKYEDDKELLEDVIIEQKQAIEMAKVYSNILSRIMDAFSAIVSNNQNNVMKLLTSITIILSIPTMISGLFGMNVQIPFSDSPSGFLYISLIIIIVSLVTSLIMFFKKLL